MTVKLIKCPKCECGVIHFFEECPQCGEKKALTESQVSETMRTDEKSNTHSARSFDSPDG